LLLSMSCGEVVNGYQCSASVADSPTGPQRDVTGLATWSTSDTTIATVNSVGFVTALKSGDVAVRVNYRGTEGFLAFDVRPGGANYYFRALSGWITDAQDKSKLIGTTVRILDGPNANRTATSTDGAYQIYDLEPGTFTIRFSKPGYVTVDRVAVLPGNRFTSLDVEMVRSVP
jgi:hypothetical protein